MLKVIDLLETLHMYIEEGLDPNTEVRMLSRPNNPIESTVNVLTSADIAYAETGVKKHLDENFLYLIEEDIVGPGTSTPWDYSFIDESLTAEDVDKELDRATEIFSKAHVGMP